MGVRGVPPDIKAEPRHGFSSLVRFFFLPCQKQKEEMKNLMESDITKRKELKKQIKEKTAKLTPIEFDIFNLLF